MTGIGMGLRNFSLGTGVSRAVAELCRRLPAHGFEPHVFAHRLPRERLDGVRVHSVSMVSLNSWIRSASFDWFCRRALRKEKVKYVHGHGDLVQQDILSVHNCDAAAAHFVPDGRRPSAGTLYLRARQLADGACRVVVANSDMVKRHLTEFCKVKPERIRRVYLGVDLEKFHPDRRAEARQKLLQRTLWTSDTKVVLSVLSGDPRKRNFSLLTRAVKLLAERNPVALCLMGRVSWSHDANARELYRRGRLLAVQEPHALEMCYAAADVFVLPAFYEEFGLTVLEAMASGCPVIVSRRCGAAEVVADGKEGYLLSDLKDPGELMELLTRSLDRPLPRAVPRAKAEQFSWDHHVRQMVTLYREFLR